MSDKRKVFRKSGIDKISSSENLNQYIKVSNPSVWLVLAAILALFIGVGIWACIRQTTPIT